MTKLVRETFYSVQSRPSSCFTVSHSTRRSRVFFIVNNNCSFIYRSAIFDIHVLSRWNISRHRFRSVPSITMINVCVHLQTARSIGFHSRSHFKKQSMSTCRQTDATRKTLTDCISSMLTTSTSSWTSDIRGEMLISFPASMLNLLADMSRTIERLEFRLNDCDGIEHITMNTGVLTRYDTFRSIEFSLSLWNSLIHLETTRHRCPINSSIHSI
jgi:hypothetical protein